MHVCIYLPKIFKKKHRKATRYVNITTSLLEFKIIIYILQKSISFSMKENDENPLTEFLLAVTGSID